MTESKLRKLIREEVQNALKPLMSEVVSILESRTSTPVNYDRNTLKSKLGIKEDSPRNPVGMDSRGERYASGKSILEWYSGNDNPNTKQLKDQGKKIEDYISNLYGE
jgi:hypothetical protein